MLAAALLSCSTAALADTIKVTGHPDYRDGVGGEFNVKPADAGAVALFDNLSSAYFVANSMTAGSANGTLMNPGYGGVLGFQTFCIEYNETISLNSTYQVTVNDGAVYGGVAGGVDPDGWGGPLPKIDLISVGTAYLYSEFVQGTLTGYVYSNGNSRASAAVTLQKAIWYLEDEISLSKWQVNANPFLQLVFNAFGTPTKGVVGNAAGGAKADNGGTIAGVRVLNLWSGGYKRQDQLVMFSVPDGGPALALLAMGIGALAWVRRRFA